MISISFYWSFFGQRCRPQSHQTCAGLVCYRLLFPQYQFAGILQDHSLVSLSNIHGAPDLPIEVLAGSMGESAGLAHTCFVSIQVRPSLESSCCEDTLQQPHQSHLWACALLQPGQNPPLK